MKYIIEIKPEYEDSFKGLMILGAKDSNLFVDALAVENLEELNSDYINEHFGDLQDTAYQRGLDYAWEAAKKVVLNPDEGGLSALGLNEIFNCATIQQVFRKYTLSEVIAKLKAYEEKQKADDEIKVGDEVIWTQDENVAIVVTCIYTKNNMEWCDGVCKDGKVYSILTENARKTGGRFDIDKYLEEINRSKTDDVC